MQRHPLSNDERTTLWHLTQHYIADPVAAAQAVELYLEENSREANDEAIVERLIGVFLRMHVYEQNAIAPERRPNQGVWEMMRHEFHGDIYKLLFEQNVEGLAAYLRNGLREKVSIGLGPGPGVYSAFLNGEDGRAANNIIILDRLVSLAEALGALPCENPEQGRRYGANVGTGLDALLASIEHQVGAEIHRPPVMGIFGFKAGDRKIIDTRLPEDVYAAHRLHALMSAGRFKHVAEIGAGFGGTAFQFIRSGGKSYTIFDLPLICIVQGYFLMKIYGGDAIKFFGEDLPDRRINILPYWEFFDRNRKLDLVYNRDSMPEMPYARAMEYLVEIAARGATFLSINQEGEADTGTVDMQQLRTSDLILGVPSMTRVSRYPYWIRRGYVEEVFEPHRSKTRSLRRRRAEKLRRTSSNGRPPVELSPAELMRLYSSLGDNCEFGLVQRRFGVDAPSLLRFAAITYKGLLDFLSSRFAHIDDPKRIQLKEVAVADGDREYLIDLPQHEMNYHTLVMASQMDPDKVLRREVLKLALERRRIIEDLEAGDKIFVFKSNTPLQDAEAIRLLEAIRSYGSEGTLLCVNDQDDEHASGTCKLVEKGLMRGWLKLAKYDSAFLGDDESWLELCRSAHALWRSSGSS